MNWSCAQQYYFSSKPPTIQHTHQNSDYQTNKKKSKHPQPLLLALSSIKTEKLTSYYISLTDYKYPKLNLPAQLDFSSLNLNHHLSKEFDPKGRLDSSHKEIGLKCWWEHWSKLVVYTHNCKQSFHQNDIQTNLLLYHTF